MTENPFKRAAMYLRGLRGPLGRTRARHPERTAAWDEGFEYARVMLEEKAEQWDAGQRVFGAHDNDSPA